MKKYLLFVASLTLGLMITSCQDDKAEFLELDAANTRADITESEITDYYWYRENRIPIKRVPNKSFVIFESSDKDELLKSLSDKHIRFNSSSIKSYSFGGIAHTKSNYSNFFSKRYESAELDINPEEAVKIQKIIYAAPFYLTNSNKEIPLTNMFYVFLKDQGDYPILEKEAREVNARIIGSYDILPNVYVLTCTKESQGNALEIANRLYETGLFEATEPVLLSFTLTSFPNDYYYYTKQWNLYNHDDQGNPLGYDIKYQQAYDSGIIPNTGNVVVAVCDSGVKLTHPELTFDPFSWDATTSTSPSVVWDEHGTTVAGVIGATANNNIGIAGVASGVKIMSISIQHLDSIVTTIDLAQMIIQAVNHGAHVINNSWSFEFNSTVISVAIDYAITNGRNGKGCVVVFSSGNDDQSSLSFPASYTPETSVIAVGASTTQGKRKAYSSALPWGSNYGTNLDIVAPGVAIRTTTTGSNYYPYYGTTYSAAHVSGVAALMLAWNPNLTYDEVGFIIESTANKSLNGYTFSNTTKVGGTWNKYVGHGLLNMYDALQMAITTSYPSYGSVAITGGQTTLNSGGSGYVGTTFTATPTNSNYKYFWSGSYSGSCDRWYVTPNSAYSPTGNVSVYLNSGQSGVLTVTCRVFNGSTYVGSATKNVYVSY